MTEDEAKGKCCHRNLMSQFALVDGEYKYQTISAPCLGSQCMAWRWSSWPDPDTNIGKGFCGLAGKP